MECKQDIPKLTEFNHIYHLIIQIYETNYQPKNLRIMKVQCGTVHIPHKIYKKTSAQFIHLKTR